MQLAQIPLAQHFLCVCCVTTGLSQQISAQLQWSVVRKAGSVHQKCAFFVYTVK